MASDPSNSQSAARSTVVRAWTVVLGAEPASDDEGFFDMGGDSLAAVAFAGELQADLMLELDLGEFFGNPTIAGVLEQFSNMNRSHPPRSS